MEILKPSRVIGSIRIYINAQRTFYVLRHIRFIVRLGTEISLSVVISSFTIYLLSKPVLQILYFGLSFLPQLSKKILEQAKRIGTNILEICLVIPLCHSTQIFFSIFFSFSLLSPLTLYYAVRIKPKLKGTEREEKSRTEWFGDSGGFDGRKVKLEKQG